MEVRIPQSSNQNTHLPLPLHLKAKVALIWTKRVAPLYSRLSLNAIREICEFMPVRPILLVTNSTELVLFDFTEKQQWSLPYTEIGVFLDYKLPGKCVSIGDSQIFICGGMTKNPQKAVRKAFIVDSFQVLPLPDMKICKVGHGLYYHEASRRVFTFSGAHSELVMRIKRNEAYDFSTATWSRFHDMITQMTSINTCGYRGKVFLCGFNSTYLEVFSIATMQFSFGPMPRDFIMCQHFVAVREKELVVIGDNLVWRFSVDTYQLLRKEEFSGEMFTLLNVTNDSVFVFKSKWMAYSLETMSEEGSEVHCDLGLPILRQEPIEDLSIKQ